MLLWIFPTTGCPSGYNCSLCCCEGESCMCGQSLVTYILEKFSTAFMPCQNSNYLLWGVNVALSGIWQYFASLYPYSWLDIDRLDNWSNCEFAWANQNNILNDHNLHSMPTDSEMTIKTNLKLIVHIIYFNISFFLWDCWIFSTRVSKCLQKQEHWPKILSAVFRCMLTNAQRRIVIRNKGCD